MKAIQSITKGEAIRRLRSAGSGHEADTLEEWRNKPGSNGGWDGWVRKAFPHVVPTNLAGVKGTPPMNSICR